MPDNRLSRSLYAGLIALQWLAVTAALASVNVHASSALSDYVTPSISDGYLLVAPFVLAVLLGVTAASMRLAIGLAMAMCVVAAVLLGAVLYAPGWLGITARTVSLQNFATVQALFVALWTVVPAVSGGVAGHFLGGGVRQAMTTPVATGVPAWWDRPDRKGEE